MLPRAGKVRNSSLHRIGDLLLKPARGRCKWRATDAAPKTRRFGFADSLGTDRRLQGWRRGAYGSTFEKHFLTHLRMLSPRRRAAHARPVLRLARYLPPRHSTDLWGW